ncbi:MAG TPA: response regulator [Bryobacteraceae bacterium]|nr:response regulator [Bryobacteraceae bacterium]
MPELDCATFEGEIARTRRSVARVLLADSDLASRLALKTLLSAAGYGVECAASASEAISRLDTTEYQLVLADLRTESEEAGARLLAYARQKEFRPATALISSKLSEMEVDFDEVDRRGEHVVSISDENVSQLLAGVADLISQRADRRMRRKLRRAS